MRRLALPGLISMLAVALVALLVFGVLQTGASNSIDQAVAKGQHPPAHDARLPLLDGPGTTSLADYRGGYLVVNFYASWCEPCAEEAPLLNAMQHALAKQGGSVIGVSWNDTTADSRTFVREHKLAFPVVRDVDGAFARAYGVNGLPETFVIDPRGRIVTLRRNQLTREWVDTVFDPLLAARRGAQ